jgi:hypothetical protein
MDEESRVGMGGFGPDSRLRRDGTRRSEFDVVVGRAIRPDSVGTDRSNKGSGFLIRGFAKPALGGCHINRKIV